MVFGRCLFISAVRCFSPSSKFHNANNAVTTFRESLLSTVALDTRYYKFKITISK